MREYLFHTAKKKAKKKNYCTCPITAMRGRQCPPKSTNWPLSSAFSFCLRRSNIYSLSRSDSWTPSWLGDLRQQPTKTSHLKKLPDRRRKTKKSVLELLLARVHSEFHTQDSLRTTFRVPKQKMQRSAPLWGKTEKAISPEWHSHEAEPKIGPMCRTWLSNPLPVISPRQW